MPGASDTLWLAELVCARISHDLGGTIGTLAQALELAEDPAVAAEALTLAGQAATELRQRLEMQRAAWGPPGTPLGLPALHNLAEGMPHAGRRSLDLSALPDDAVFSPHLARVLLNLLLVAGDALNGSGEVRLSGSGTDLQVAIAGPRAAWPAGLMRCLTDDAAAWDVLTDARSIHLPLTTLLAHAYGLRLTLLLPPGRGGLPPPLRLQEV